MGGKVCGYGGGQRNEETNATRVNLGGGWGYVYTIGVGGVIGTCKKM